MKTKLHATKNGLAIETRRAMVSLLNQQLADALDLGLQAKQAHWNVKGPHFIGLHELFDKVAEELEEFIDEIAERAPAENENPGFSHFRSGAFSWGTALADIEHGVRAGYFAAGWSGAGGV